MSGAELVIDARCVTGESPVWLSSEQALYWVDIPQGILHCWQSQLSLHSRWQAPQMLACMAAWSGSPGSWIAGLEDGIYRLQQSPLSEGAMLQVQALAQVRHEQAGMRFNDGRCDRQGRFLAGTMQMDMGAAQGVGKIYRLGPQELSAGTCTDLQLGPLVVPNGMAFSPDGQTMYLSDSHPSVQAIWAFDYDVDSGVPHSRRLFKDMKPLPGRPDGAAMDSDGCYWICANDAGLIHRFTPAGRLDRSLAVPVKKPAMCAFGGARLDTLYVTSIRPQQTDLSDEPMGGAVFALRPGVQGLEEPLFAPTTASG
jgi:sugar lactone lactonase YvrE